MTTRPDLSIVMVSNRPHFWSWSIHQVEKQLRYLSQKGLYVDLVLVVPKSHYKRAEEEFKVTCGLKIKAVDDNSTIGTMRNRGCTASDGNIIAFMDDDDWFSEFRLHIQWSRLFISKLEVAGVDSYLCYDVPGDRLFWHMGSSESCLMFKRTFFNKGHRFNEEATRGEGTTFVGQEKIYIEDSCELIVALSHKSNTVVRNGFELLCAQCTGKAGEWCVECAEEMMSLEKAYGKLPPKGLLPSLFDPWETEFVAKLRQQVVSPQTISTS